MRAPLQILVLPYKIEHEYIMYAVLKRSDVGWWQFVSGGGEDDESPEAAAVRECHEEIGTPMDIEFLCLESKSSVPKNIFPEAENWDKDLYVIPVFCFAVNMGKTEIILSSEHTEIKWFRYDEAKTILKWQSNEMALWELNARLLDLTFNIKD